MKVAKNKQLDLQLGQLKAFLESAARPEGTFNLEQLYGYLFAVACAPEMIMPSQWLPIIFNDEDAGYSGLDEANTILQVIMLIYNDLNRQVLERSPALPACCQPVNDAMQNLEPDSSLAMWAQGFLEGHDFMLDIWNDHTPDEFDEELGSCMMILSFFADAELASAYHAESAESGVTLEAMADSMLKLFPEAMRAYAHLGRTIYEAGLGQAGNISQSFFADPKTGRNDPCPCGSGKKYKHCCLH